MFCKYSLIQSISAVVENKLNLIKINGKENKNIQKITRKEGLLENRMNSILVQSMNNIIYII